MECFLIHLPSSAFHLWRQFPSSVSSVTPWFISSFLSRKCAQHNSRRHRDFADAHADRVVHGIRDGAGSRDRRGFTDSGGVGATAAPELLYDNRLDHRRLAAAENLVLLEV